MYALFLESKAAEQCLTYAKAQEWDDATTQDLLRRCYANDIAHLKVHNHDGENWWVEKCLDDDRHKTFRIGDLFIWGRTPEGHEYWAEIDNWRQ